MKIADLANNRQDKSRCIYDFNVGYKNNVLICLCMTHLEKLTLYLRIGIQSAFVDGTDLHNDIPVRMPKLRTFIFYTSTETIGILLHML